MKPRAFDTTPRVHSHGNYNYTHQQENRGPLFKQGKTLRDSFTKSKFWPRLDYFKAHPSRLSPCTKDPSITKKDILVIPILCIVHEKYGSQLYQIRHLSQNKTKQIVK
jgi:hypothetical protein